MEKDNTWTNKGKNYADDRIPTIEEIRKLFEYPGQKNQGCSLKLKL